MLRRATHADRPNPIGISSPSVGNDRKARHMTCAMRELRPTESRWLWPGPSPAFRTARRFAGPRS